MGLVFYRSGKRRRKIRRKREFLDRPDKKKTAVVGEVETGLFLGYRFLHLVLRGM